VDDKPDDKQQVRPWWRRVPFLVLVGVLPVPFGMFFAAFVAIALLLSDQTRETETRAGGAVLLFWWAYSFREGDTAPYAAGLLLAIAAVLFVRGAWKRRSAGGRHAWVPALGAVLAVALGVAAYVPDGYREASVTRVDAVRRTLAARQAHPWKGIAADEYLVQRGRVRFVHTPVWYVALYERNPRIERTADLQPCFSRREVWQVNALDGSVSRTTYDDAVVNKDPCLPIRLGTEADLRPVSGVG
jgi:hypothetical protein